MPKRHNPDAAPARTALTVGEARAGPDEAPFAAVIQAGRARDAPPALDHANRKHSILGASKAKQWLHCPPSARLEELIPEQTSVYAEAGTAAHELGEYKIRHGYLHDRMQRPQSDFYTEEIEEATDIYAEFVISAIEEMKRAGTQPLVLVEERLDYSHVAPDGFGTGDIVIVGKTADGKGLIHVVDYKNGKGVMVDADHNPQMMLYAIGALHAYGYIFDIKVIRMTIVQPRLDNISTFECSREELDAWAESIKPTAKLAYEGKGEQACGDWCRFCKVKPTCAACAREALALAQEEFLDLDAEEAVLSDESPDRTPSMDQDKPPTFKQPSLIPLPELAKLLPTLDRISGWIESVFAYVSSEAIGHGVPIPGYKVVEGRSRRVFTDTKAVVDAATRNGYTDLYKSELISLTEFEKMMGKKRFAEILGEYVAKPPGKLTLVEEDDPRPAVDMSSASDDFDVLEDETNQIT